jgi:alkylation response protein AidB-like acyl-CoA dehydrogenase
MPASTPLFGVPKIALVMARLIVNNEDRGCRFFLVPICDEKEMCRGVRSTRLPPRSGTCPLDFSITSFDHVFLPDTALVASDYLDLSTPSRRLESWWDEIWRIQLGTLSVPAPWVSATKAVAFIGGRYSMWRCILGKHDIPTPILSFRTQQWAVAHATAVSMVMDNWYPLVVREAMQQADPRLRHALSVIAKTTICRHFQRSVSEVAERCGAQGTFDQNYMARIEVRYLPPMCSEPYVLTFVLNFRTTERVLSSLKEIF